MGKRNRMSALLDDPVQSINSPAIEDKINKGETEVRADSESNNLTPVEPEIKTVKKYPKVKLAKKNEEEVKDDVNVKVSTGIRDRLKIVAVQKGIKLYELVEEALIEKLEKLERKGS